jgi:hypothetical protein
MSDEDELTPDKRGFGEGTVPFCSEDSAKGDSPRGFGQIRSALEKPCPTKTN